MGCEQLVQHAKVSKNRKFIPHFRENLARPLDKGGAAVVYLRCNRQKRTSVHEVIDKANRLKTGLLSEVIDAFQHLLTFYRQVVDTTDGCRSAFAGSSLPSPLEAPASGCPPRAASGFRRLPGGRTRSGRNGPIRADATAASCFACRNSLLHSPFASLPGRFSGRIAGPAALPLGGAGFRRRAAGVPGGGNGSGGV